MHDKIAMGVLMYFVLPLWLAAGFADYLCHRVARIEHTTGPKESLIHLLLFAEMGVPMLASMFLEVNASVLLLIAAGLVLHEATTLWDISYAEHTRGIGWIEQHIHGVLEMIPVLALCLMVVLHWEQAFALVGAGPQAADFSIRFKYQALPTPYVVVALTIVFLVGIVPLLDELRRSMKARHAIAMAEPPAAMRQSKA